MLHGDIHIKSYVSDDLTVFDSSSYYIDKITRQYATTYNKQRGRPQ